MKGQEIEQKFIAKLKKYDRQLYETMAHLVSMSQRLDRIMEVILTEGFDEVQKQIMINVYYGDIPLES